MLDPKTLRSDIETVAKKLLLKGYQLDVAKFNATENLRKSLQVETQELQSIRNQRSKEIGKAKSQGQDISELKAQMDVLSQQLKDKEQQFQSLQNELNEWLSEMPNIPDESVPAGHDEDDNQLLNIIH